MCFQVSARVCYPNTMKPNTVKLAAQASFCSRGNAVVTCYDTCCLWASAITIRKLENMCYLSWAAEPVVPSFPPENRWSGVVRKLGIPKNLVVKSFTRSLSSRRCLQDLASIHKLLLSYIMLQKKTATLGETSPQPSPAITSHDRCLMLQL